MPSFVSNERAMRLIPLLNAKWEQTATDWNRMANTVANSGDDVQPPD
jgi:hypothetical protein